MPHIHELYDFTTSAFILHPTEPKICLAIHRKLNKWLQPGGHIELDQDPLEGLQAELKEEIGFLPNDFTILEPADSPDVPGNKHLPLPFYLNTHHFGDSKHQHIDICYLVRAIRTDFHPEEGESTDIKWHSWEDIRALKDEGTIFEGTYSICEWIFKHKV